MASKKTPKSGEKTRSSTSVPASGVSFTPPKPPPDKEGVEMEVEVLQLREALAELEGSRERLSRLFDDAPVGYVILDPAGLILVANAHAGVLLGQRPDLLAFSPFRRFLDERDNDKFISHLERCCNAGKGPVVTQLRLNTTPPRAVELTSNVISLPQKKLYHTAVIDQTALLKTQQDLQESRERYRLLFNSVAEVFALGEAERNAQGNVVNFKILEVNSAWEQYMNIPASRALGRMFRDVLPDIAEAWLEEMIHVMNSGRPLRKVIQGIVRNRWLMLSAFKVPEDHIAILLLDITERKQAEEALEQSEREYRLLFEENPVAMWIFDADTQEILRVNEAALAQYGYTRTEFLALRLSDLIVPELRQVMIQAVQQHDPRLVDGSIWKHMRKDGTRLHVEISTHDLRLEGRTVRLVHAKDVSARVQAEQTLRLREQQLRYHVENSPLAVVEWDGSYIVKMWSGEAERMFGWTTAECVGRNIADLDIIYPEDVPVVRHTMERLGSGVEKTVVSENRNVTKDGRVIHCIWYNSVLTDHDGRMTSVMSLVEDVTPEREAMAMLRKTVDSLRVLVSSSSDSMALLDSEGTVLCASKRAASALGYAAHEFEGKKWPDLLPREQEIHARLYLRDLTDDSARPVTGTLRLRTASGEVAWYSLSASVVSLGNATGYLVYVEQVSR